MRFLAVGLYKDYQLLRLKEEGEKRGHEVEGSYSSSLIVEAGNDFFEPRIRNKKFDYDLIYLWAVAKRRWEWYTTCLYLREKFGTKIVNLRNIDLENNLYPNPLIDYLKQVKNSLPFPRSFVILSLSSLGFIIDKIKFPVVVKIAIGSKGRGVMLAKDKDDLYQKTRELLKISSSVIVREYIPNDGDIRVFTIGYEAIGAMKRIPAPGEFRSNISLGGRGEPFDLDSFPEIGEIAEKISRILKVEIAGVDIMLDKNTNNPYILEVNLGPQFKGLEKYTGINVAGKIISYFEDVVNGRKQYP